MASFKELLISVDFTTAHPKLIWQNSQPQAKVLTGVNLVFHEYGIVSYGKNY